MPKEIRFSKLVQKAGKPETITLWTKPKDNPAFMKAINENQVVTVFQKPAGTKRDFGKIGFHQEQFATYLVFPKSLPKLGDAQIIGIKYDLLKQAMESRPAREDHKSTKAVPKAETHADLYPSRDGVSKLKAKPESAKKFQVKVVRSATAENVMTVSAKNISEAEENALEMVKNEDFQPEQINDEVKSITEI
jgi:hypothetical protein